MIPNYHLEKCHFRSIFQNAPENLFTSLRSIRYRLWDEDSKDQLRDQSIN